MDRNISAGFQINQRYFFLDICLGARPRSSCCPCITSHLHWHWIRLGSSLIGAHLENTLRSQHVCHQPSLLWRRDCEMNDCDLCKFVVDIKKKGAASKKKTSSPTAAFANLLKQRTAIQIEWHLFDILCAVRYAAVLFFISNLLVRRQPWTLHIFPLCLWGCVRASSDVKSLLLGVINPHPLNHNVSLCVVYVCIPVRVWAFDSLLSVAATRTGPRVDTSTNLLFPH